MVGTLVRGSRKTRLAVAAAHIAAAAMAAGLAGMLLAGVGGMLPTASSLVILALLTVAYLGAELALWPMPVPQTSRQVPSRWRRRFPQPVTAALYGALLAPGVGTTVPFPSFVIVLAAAALSGSLMRGAIIMGSYGVMRAIVAVLVANLSKTFPSIDITLGYRYRWLLSLLAIASASMYLGGCVGAFARFL